VDEIIPAGVNYLLPDFKVYDKLWGLSICDDHLKIRATFITAGKIKGTVLSDNFCKINITLCLTFLGVCCFALIFVVHFILFFLKILLIHLSERERERENKQGEGQREREKQTAH